MDYSLQTLKTYLASLDDRTIVVFDVETNGLKRYHSVLSIAAIKYRFSKDGTAPLTEIDNLIRYYYAREPENRSAIAVNGLTASVIAERRGGAAYPEHFDQDREVVAFFQDAGIVVAHNVEFDKMFLSVFPQFPELHYFCTMKGFGGYIKLYDLAVREKVLVDVNKLHDSSYDARLAGKLFEKLVSTVVSC